MQSVIIRFFEMIIGALVLSVGLIYLLFQVKTMNQTTEFICDEVISNTDIYQQSNDISIHKVSDTELYAIIMGYREYPIIIEGHLIDPDGTDYETYISYIRDDYYWKSYEYDTEHLIRQIVFTNIGT